MVPSLGIIDNTSPCSSLARLISGGSKGGARDAPPPPLGAQILSISCSFQENMAKSYVGAPPGELAPPPRGNPGSATAYHCLRFKEIFLET